MNLRKTLVFLLLTAIVGSTPRAEQIVLQAFDVLDLEYKSGPVPPRLQIRAFGRSFTLNLTPNRALLASLPSSQRARIAGADAFLKGTLEGVPGSWVRLNRIDGRFSGGFFDGVELYLIDQASGFPAARASVAIPDRNIVFRFADLELDTVIDHGGVYPDEKPGSRTSTQDPIDYLEFVGHLRDIVALGGGPLLAMPVTIVSDVQFTGDHGNNTASVVAGRVNFVDGIYTSQLGTGIQLLHHEILTDNGVLVATEAGDLLTGRFNGNNLEQPGFRQFMRDGAGSSLPFGGLAHLFTGRDLNGGTVGIAYVGVLCNRSFGYGVNQNLNSETTSALVFAHELGHNFNAPHDGEGDCSAETFRGIMNPRINGSEQFSDCSLAEMAPAVAAASCLVEDIDSQYVFGDGFE